VVKHQRRARPSCKIGQKRFTVVVINHDPYDSHAARSFERAMESASPDRGAHIDVYVTCAADVGEARMPFNYKKSGVLTRSFRSKKRG
jgi:hypothetical protein